MKLVATQLEDAGVVIKHIVARLLDVSDLDGKHKPDDSLREVKDAIAYTNHLAAILDNLRERYVDAVVASQQDARSDAAESRLGLRPRIQLHNCRCKLEIVK